jgi:hypothetical protein
MYMHMHLSVNVGQQCVSAHARNIERQILGGHVNGHRRGRKRRRRKETSRRRKNNRFHFGVCVGPKRP